MLSADALLEDGERALGRGHAARAWDLATLGLARDPGVARPALLGLQARAAATRAATSERARHPAAPLRSSPPTLPPEVGAASAAVKERRLDDAIALLDQAITRLPDCAAAHALRGMALLSLGKFREGFASYEWRHRVPGFEGDRPPGPSWDGRGLDGQTLLLWDEQGLGDTILFARFAAATARASRARVVLSANPRICRLLRACPGVDAVVPRNRGFPPADAQLSLLSLPAILGFDADAFGTGGPLLAAEPALVAAWKNRLGQLVGLGGQLPGAPRVGLAWQGNPCHPEDAHRSLPLATLGPLVRRSAGRATFISVQKEGAREALRASSLPIVDLGAELDAGPDAFVDTAAVISELDLVITTDTAVAHLAIALGTPTWVLLPRPCDWRWGLDGARSVFIPTARLFRQPTPGDWAGAIDEATATLATLGRRREPAPRAGRTV